MSFLDKRDEEGTVSAVRRRKGRRCVSIRLTKSKKPQGTTSAREE